jgi:hypothetical protein
MLGDEARGTHSVRVLALRVHQRSSGRYGSRHSRVKSGRAAHDAGALSGMLVLLAALAWCEGSSTKRGRGWDWAAGGPAASALLRLGRLRAPAAVVQRGRACCSHQPR